MGGWNIVSQVIIASSTVIWMMNCLREGLDGWSGGIAQKWESEKIYGLPSILGRKLLEKVASRPFYQKL